MNLVFATIIMSLQVYSDQELCLYVVFAAVARHHDGGLHFVLFDYLDVHLAFVMSLHLLVFFVLYHYLFHLCWSFLYLCSWMMQYLFH